MKRNIYNSLMSWKNNKKHKPLIVLGVRQCGKTYIIKKFIEENYKNYQVFDLLSDDRIVELYKRNITSDNKYLILKSMINFDLEQEDSILFVDEVQLSEEFISNLKYMNEKHPNINIICAGSLLGVELSRLSQPFPVGKVDFLHMYPMSFDEFLRAYGKEKYIDLINDSYKNNKKMFSGIHTELLELYKVYLVSGGMPEAVRLVVNDKNVYMNDVRRIVSDIIVAYLNDMKKYVESPSETLKIRTLYRSIPTQLGNLSHKFQISKIGHGSRYREYESSLDWLIHSNMIFGCYAIKKPDVPLDMYVDDKMFKLYLSDVGVLTSLLNISPSDILLDNLGEHKGIISENFVACELIKNNFILYYWADPEVDFVIKIGQDIIPIEVKSADNSQSKALKSYMNKFNPKYAIKISTKNFGYDPVTKIKSIPLYSTFCIKEEDNLKLDDFFKKNKA